MRKASVRTSLFILIAASAVLVAFSLIGCSFSGSGDSPESGSSQDSVDYTLIEEGKLTVASDLATPPFEYADDSGEPQGFTVELMGMIA